MNYLIPCIVGGLLGWFAGDVKDAIETKRNQQIDRVCAQRAAIAVLSTDGWICVDPSIRR